MNHRWTLSILLATFLGVAALLFLVRGLTARVVDLEAQLARPKSDSAANSNSPATPESAPDSMDGDEPTDGNILENPDLAAKLNWLIEKLEEVEDANYEADTDIQDTLFNLERNDAKIITRLRRLGGSKNIPESGRALTNEERAAALAAAAAQGIDVKVGRVSIRAVLNAYSLRRHGTKYPFELLAARYPSEKDYETLILVVGNRTPEDLQQVRYAESKAATLALYMAMRAAGFLEGEGTRVDPASEDPKKPNILLASGDVVYMYARYKYKDKVYIERINDWLTDGETGEALPADAFRFTGSPRTEDSETGDQTVVAALTGTIASQYPNPRSLIEIAHRGALKVAVGFSAAAIPRPLIESHFFVDFILTKEPIAFTPRDQLPTFPPAPKVGEIDEGNEEPATEDGEPKGNEDDDK